MNREGNAMAGLRPNALGVASIVFFVVAAAAPLTAIVGAAPLAFSIGNGAGAPVAYVIAGVVYLFFAVGFTAMSRYVGSAGAFYVFVARGLGTAWGAAAGGMTLLTYVTIQLAVYAFFGIVLAGIAESIGIALPWWVFTALSIVVVDLFATRNIELSGKVLGICMICEVAVLTVLNVVILLQGGGPEGISLTSFSPEVAFSAGLGVSLLFAVASFIGFEATVIFAEEARDPRRTIPRATYVAVVLITVFYAFSAWCMVIAYGPSHIREIATGDLSNLFINTAGARVGEWLKVAMNAFLVTSLFACVLSFQNTISRYLFAWGRDRILPQRLGQVDGRHQSPRLACRLQTAIALATIVLSGLFGLDPYSILYSWLAAASALGILIVQILVCLAIVWFFRIEPHGTSPWQRLIAPILAAGGLGTCLLIALSNLSLLTGDETWRVWLIPGAFVLAGMFGWIRAQHMKSVSPESYSRLASSTLAD
jgi:amino acid transporter